MEINKQTKVVVVGASSAGLAVAAYLKKNKIPYILLEKTNVVASKWRSYYDRLHLHTPKSISSLPFYKMPKSYTKYVPKKEVVAYFEAYTAHLELNPVFNTEVTKIEKKDSFWEITTAENSVYQSEYVVVATGNTRFPKMVTKKGLDTFKGEVLHSAEYVNGSAFKGKNVLVVGFGNSACEIAICLTEHGANASLSVRSKVNVLPRDIFGMSTMKMGMTTNFLPNKVADMVNAPLVKAVVGDITKLGLKKSPYGPKEQVAVTGKVPLLDIGTIDLIKKGKIQVFGDIISIAGHQITFEEDKKDNFDAIIFATGFNHGLAQMVTISDERLQDIKLQMRNRKTFGNNNIYYAGFHVSLDGMIRECGIEAKYIYKDIAKNIK